MNLIQLAFFLCALALTIGLFMPSAWCLLIGVGLVIALWLENRDTRRGP
jgi:hypothetical protein